MLKNQGSLWQASKEGQRERVLSIGKHWFQLILSIFDKLEWNLAQNRAHSATPEPRPVAPTHLPWVPRTWTSGTCNAAKQQGCKNGRGSTNAKCQEAKKHWIWISYGYWKNISQISLKTCHLIVLQTHKRKRKRKRERASQPAIVRQRTQRSEPTNGQTNEREDTQTNRIKQTFGKSSATRNLIASVSTNITKEPWNDLKCKTVRCRLQAHWRVHSHLKSQIAFGLSSHKTDVMSSSYTPSSVVSSCKQSVAAKGDSQRCVHTWLHCLGDSCASGHIIDMETSEAKVFHGVSGPTDPWTIWTYGPWPPSRLYCPWNILHWRSTILGLSLLNLYEALCPQSFCRPPLTMTIRQTENYSAAPLLPWTSLKLHLWGCSDTKALQVETSEHLCWNDCMVVCPLLDKWTMFFLHITQRNIDISSWVPISMVWNLLFQVPKSWQIHTVVLESCVVTAVVGLWVFE